MCGDHPALADDAFEGDQLSLFFLVGRIGGDVDVAATIVEVCASFRAGQAIPGCRVERELEGDPCSVVLGFPFDINPEQLVAAQSPWTILDRFQTLDLITVKQDRLGQCPTPLLSDLEYDPIQRRQLAPSRLSDE